MFSIEFSDNRLTSLDLLTDLHCDLHTWLAGQHQVNLRAKANDADPLSQSHILTLTDEGRKRYEAKLAALAHSGPSRTDVDLVVRKLDRIFGSSSADATTTITSGPSAVTARVLSMMAKVAEPTVAVAPTLLPGSADATTQ